MSPVHLQNGRLRPNFGQLVLLSPPGRIERNGTASRIFEYLAFDVMNTMRLLFTLKVGLQFREALR